MERENKWGGEGRGGGWKNERGKSKKKARKKERKEVEIRGTNMALLVAVAETSAEETTPHLEHLSVMP